MRQRWRSAFLSLTLLVGLHASMLQRPRFAFPRQVGSGSALWHLRGGKTPAEEEGSEMAAKRKGPEQSAAEVVDPTPQLANDDEGHAPSCWSALQKLWSVVKSLLMPNHQYAKSEAAFMKETPEESCGYAPDDESWRTQRKKLNQVELPPAARKRVLRDLRRMKNATSGLELEDSECLTDWVVKLVGTPGTVFAGEVYRLRIRFHADYPTRPPTVVFMRPAPMYEHVYSNGMVCLDLLGNAWDSQLDVLGICLSIQSMLSSAKKKSRPPDNEVTSVMAKGQDARDMAWHPHDDEC